MTGSPRNQTYKKVKLVWKIRNDSLSPGGLLLCFKNKIDLRRGKETDKIKREWSRGIVRSDSLQADVMLVSAALGLPLLGLPAESVSPSLSSPSSLQGLALVHHYSVSLYSCLVSIQSYKPPL